MALPLKFKSLHLLTFVLVFLIVLCADQVSKQIMLNLLFDPPRYIEIGVNLNLVPVWNSGMSLACYLMGAFGFVLGSLHLPF